VDKKIDDEAVSELRNCMILYVEERIVDHYLFGLKQISEIAVKAMSPGINDPGTAVKAIDMLTVLLIRKMRIKENNVLTDGDGRARVYLKVPGLEFLFFQNLVPIRSYSKSDVNVMLNLLESLKNMAYADKESLRHQRVITKYIQSMASSCYRHINNDIETEQVNRMIETINRLLGDDYRVDYGEKVK
jgi:uncharacterized membrane protein